MKALGYGSLDAAALVKMRIHGVTPEFMREMKIWLRHDRRPTLVRLRIHGVTPAFVRELRALGYDLSPDQLVKLRIHGVTTEFVTELRGLGYTNVPVEDLVRMRIHGVTPAFIKDVQAAGFKDMSPSDLVDFSIHGKRWLRKRGCIARIRSIGLGSNVELTPTASVLLVHDTIRGRRDSPEPPYRSQVPTVHRYFLALFISLVALVIRFIMAPLWETTAPFALFMFATVITAWFAGTGPAIVTGAAGLLTRLYFDSSATSGGLPLSWEEAVRLTLFGGFVIGSAVVSLADARRSPRPRGQHQRGAARNRGAAPDRGRPGGGARRRRGRQSPQGRVPGARLA